MLRPEALGAAPGPRTVVVSLYRDAFDVYIGRPGRGQPGEFGNPFRPAQDTAEARDHCLRQFLAYFLRRLDDDPEFCRRVLALRGRRLGCFCAPRGGLTADDRPWRCHGQVIAAYCDGLL